MESLRQAGQDIATFQDSESLTAEKSTDFSLTQVMSLALAMIQIGLHKTLAWKMEIQEPSRILVSKFTHFSSYQLQDHLQLNCWTWNPYCKHHCAWDLRDRHGGGLADIKQVQSHHLRHLGILPVDCTSA